MSFFGSLIVGAMKIRLKLALIFTVLSGICFAGILVVIYTFMQEFANGDFVQRLNDHARSEADILINDNKINVSGVSSSTFDFGLVGEHLQVFDRKGILLYKWPKNSRTLPLGFLENLAKQNEVIFREYQSSTFLGIHYPDKKGPFLIVVSATDVYGITKLNYLSNIMFVALVIAVVLLYSAGWFFAGRALSPVSKMVSQVKNIEANNIHTRLEIRSPIKNNSAYDELDELADTFNDMLNRLETVFELQRRFVQHASHEINTPLTSILGEIDLLLARPRSSEDYNVALLSIQFEAERLSNLSRSMLLLARLEGPRSNLGNEIFSFVDLVESLSHEILKYYEGRKFIMNLDEKVRKETVDGNVHLLTVAVRNVLDNALKYSKNDVSVDVNLVERELVLTVTDTGIGIPNHEMAKIGMPLFRAENTGGIKGTGLGLALVKRVMEIHHGGLQVFANTPRGLQVILKLPVLD